MAEDERPDAEGEDMFSDNQNESATAVADAPDEEGDIDAYLNALKTKDADIITVAKRLKQEEAELSQMQQDVREKRKGVNSLRSRLVDMAEAEPGQTSLPLDGEEDDGDPGRDTAYDAGYRAFGKGESEDDNPYPDDMEQARQKWMDGFAQAAVDAEKPYRENTRDISELGIECAECCENHMLVTVDAKKGKPVTATPIEAWLSQFLAFEPSADAPDDTAVTLVPIYPVKTWDETYADMYGARWMFEERSNEAPNQIDHGEHCGLVVKVGRKQYAIGSLKDAIHIVEAEQAGAEAQDDDEQAQADDSAADSQEEPAA